MLTVVESRRRRRRSTLESLVAAYQLKAVAVARAWLQGPLWPLANIPEKCAGTQGQTGSILNSTIQKIFLSFSIFINVPLALEDALSTDGSGAVYDYIRLFISIDPYLKLYRWFINPYRPTGSYPGSDFR